jgi:alcohol dehydrogenase
MEFDNPVKLILGSCVREKIAEECPGKRVLIFCTKSALERYKKDPVLAALLALDNIAFEHAFDSNPSVSDIVEISKKYRNETIDLIVGMGGGSTMDVAKVASISIPAHRREISVTDLLGDVEHFSGLESIDCIQVPTTAGTGSEVTPFATIWDYSLQKKRSLSNRMMYAKKAFIDPDFLTDIPVEIAISTGLDALNQAFESIWNVNANEFTRPFARRAAVLSLQALHKIDESSQSDELREQLATASLFSGLAISQTRTSICHSISYPLTLKYGIPHGLACAFSMLEVYKYNAAYVSDDIGEIAYSLKEDPFLALERIFCKCNLHSSLKKALPEEAIFFGSIEEFITEGRLENNIRECSKSDLLRIITSSYRLALS